MDERRTCNSQFAQFLKGVCKLPLVFDKRCSGNVRRQRSTGNGIKFAYTLTSKSIETDCVIIIFFEVHMFRVRDVIQILMLHLMVCT